MNVRQRIYERLEEVDLRGGPPVVLTIGTFDGVHLAHRQLLDEAVMRAGLLGGVAAALTFRNHPRAVVSPNDCPPLLTDWETKKDLILARGVNVLIGLSFSPEFAMTSAEAFVRDVISGRIAARHVISGPDFHFGHDARGNARLLEEMGSTLGYTYKRREPVMYGGEKVSSTRIRAALARGDVALAAQLLVRHHMNIGTVVAGDGIGRRIGFPTANLDVRPDLLVPGDGVYAVRVHASDESNPMPGMMNIGWRPTVDGRDHRKEVHIIGFSGDLTNCQLRVEYIQRLRDEKRFPSLDELRFQLSRDREKALEVLAD